MSTFLNEMDGIDGSKEDGVLILGATNRPSTIDRALLRPGRFDRLIYVPPPGRVERQKILEKQIDAWNLSSSNNNRLSAKDLSSDEITGSMTGAEIVGACREAAMLAIRDAIDAAGIHEGKCTDSSIPTVLNHHLIESFGSVKPLLSDPKVSCDYNHFESQNK